jgi:hypothetical protein
MLEEQTVKFYGWKDEIPQEIRRQHYDLLLKRRINAGCCYSEVPMPRIEDLDFRKYCELCDFLGFQAKVTQGDFDSLRESKPHAFWRKRNVDQWTEQEVHEFESQTGELAQRFGYPYRVADLVDEARAERAESLRRGRIPQPKQGPRFWRARRAAAEWLRGFAKSVDVS